MYILYLPLVIGSFFGIAPDDDSAPAMTAAAPTETAGTDRSPEDQTPTGKFTTAGEVRMILDMTKPQWIAIRPYEGQDLLYFTQLASWRCGLWDVHYGVNGAPPETPFDLEPCHDDSPTPNAMTQIEDFLPYITFPLDSLEQVEVRVTYDDGSTDTATYERSAVLMP